MVRDLFDSFVRTFVPVIVGAVVSWLSLTGVELDASLEGSLTVVVTAGITAVYYVVARLLEVYVAPQFGWLLGVAKAPEYGVSASYRGKHIAASPGVVKE